MDHRWDEGIRQERGRRAEQSRYGRGPIERDPEVERRDRLAEARRRKNRSPWEIGAAHWDQRDLYTRNSEIVDSGYARGPSFHPEEGSYAYPRSIGLPRVHLPRVHADDEPTVYEREAWPWLNYYDRVQHRDERGVWRALKHEAAALVRKLTGRQRRDVTGWWRADDAIRAEVCATLAFAEGLDARDIEVAVEGAEVWLKGTVRSRSQKRLAEDLTERVRGVVDVHNQLTLRRDDDLGFTAPVPAY